MLIQKKATKNSQLVIPQEALKKIGGNSRRRITAVITNPRSRHIILTRYPEDYASAWYKTTIERGTDFIPTAILKKAKIQDDKHFNLEYNSENLIVRRFPKATA